MTDTPIAPPLDSRAREFTILMASMMSIVAISIDAFLPALGMVGKDLNLTNPNHAQYLISFIFLGMALGQLVCGPLSDALGRKKVLYAGIALYLVGSVICLVADNLTMMLCGRFLQGLGVSGPYVSAISIVRDKYSGRHMARVMSVIMTIFILVPAVAPTLGQAILTFASWRAIFLLYVLYALAVGTWLYFRLEETLPPEKRVPFNPHNLLHGLREIVGNRATFCYTICMGICFGSFIGYLNSSQQIFQVQFDAGKMFTIYFGALALVLGGASMVNSRLVEALGMRHICKASFLCVVVSSALFLGLHAFSEIHLWMFLIYAAILFFCFGLVFGNLNALAMEPMGHIAGTASAVIGCCSSVISMTLGAAIGQMYDNTLIPVASGFMVLGALALVFMKLANPKTYTERVKA